MLKKLSRVRKKHVNQIYTLQDLLKISCETYGILPAVKIKCKNEIYEVSYKKIWNDVIRVARIFKGKGYNRQRIAMIGSLNYDWLVVFWAIEISGNIAVLLNDEMTDLFCKINEASCVAIYVDCKSKNIIQIKEGILDVFLFSNGTNDLLNINQYNMYNVHVENYILPVINEQQEAVIVYTSGTTGISKGVVLTHKNIISGTKVCLFFIEDDVFEGDFTIPVLPPSHMLELTVGILTGFYYGITICLGKGLRYIEQDMQTFKPKVMVMVPLLVESLYKKIKYKIKEDNKETNYLKMIKFSNSLRRIGVDLRRIIFRKIHKLFGGNLKTIICGGAPLNPLVIEEMDSIGIQIRCGYGITECSPTIACNLSYKKRIGSVGIKAPDRYCDVKIINGEICVSGDIVFKEYLGDSENTKMIMKDGYFHTGDLGFIDKDNFIFITGRKKNLIIMSDGNNVSPEELEKIFQTEKIIQEIFIALKRYNDKDYITAFIYPDMEYVQENNIYDISEYVKKIIDKANNMLPVYKRIKKFEILEGEAEKNNLGKIKRV